MSSIKIENLVAIIKSAAQAELIPRFKQCQSHFKADGSYLTEADLAVQEYVQKQLQLHWPEIGFLAEEMADDEMQGFMADNPSGFWCLDPIDGTSNFATGLPYFAISLALIQSSQTVLGIVYDPIRDECFTAIRGQGAWLNQQAIALSHSYPILEKTIGLVDIKRLAPELRQQLVLQPPYHSQRSFGSVALDWCWLATERAHLYLHGRQKIWDYAAGLLVAQEVGCHTIGLDGRDVFQMDLSTRQAVGAVSQTLFDQWCEYLHLPNRA